MAEFSLPKNSKVREGKTWPAPEGAKNPKQFRVYRWNGDDGETPQVDTYTNALDMNVDGLRIAVVLHDTRAMLLPSQPFHHHRRRQSSRSWP